MLKPLGTVTESFLSACSQILDDIAVIHCENTSLAVRSAVSLITKMFGFAPHTASLAALRDTWGWGGKCASSVFLSLPYFCFYLSGPRIAKIHEKVHETTPLFKCLGPSVTFARRQIEIDSGIWFLTRNDESTSSPNATEHCTQRNYLVLLRTVGIASSNIAQENCVDTAGGSVATEHAALEDDATEHCYSEPCSATV